MESLDVPYLFTINGSSRDVTMQVGIPNGMGGSQVNQYASRGGLNLPSKIFDQSGWTNASTYMRHVFIITDSNRYAHIFGKGTLSGSYHNVNGGNRGDIIGLFSQLPITSIIHVDKDAGIVRVYYMGGDNTEISANGSVIPIVNLGPPSTGDKKSDVPADLGNVLFSRTWYDFFFGSQLWQTNQTETITSVRVEIKNDRFLGAWAQTKSNTTLVPYNHGEALRPYLDGKHFPDGVYYIRRNADGTYTSDFVRPTGQKLGGIAMALAMVGLLIIGAGKLKV